MDRNIFTNYPCDSQAGVIHNHITDHFPIFLSIMQTTTPVNIEKVTKWNYNRSTITKYQQLLEEIEFPEIVNNSTQTSYTILNDKMIKIHKESFKVTSSTGADLGII